MPIYTGTLLTGGTSDSRMDEIKALISTYLSDHVTLVSDSGSGNTRVLKYSSPYSNHRFNIVYIYSFGNNLRLRNIADTADLTGGSVSANITKNLTYTIITNQDSFILRIDHFLVVGSKAGSKHMFCIKNSIFYSFAYGTDYAITDFIDFNINIARTLENGEELFYPAYASDDYDGAFLDGPCSDIFCFLNKKAIATFNQFTCNGQTFFVIEKTLGTLTYVIRVN